MKGRQRPVPHERHDLLTRVNEAPSRVNVRRVTMLFSLTSSRVEVGQPIRVPVQGGRVSQQERSPAAPGGVRKRAIRLHRR
jgi:hypothetical protein